MAESGQSAFAEPMTMREALEKADSLMETKEAEPAEEEILEEDPEPIEQEPDEEPDAEEPEAVEEESQILTADEYGDVLVDVNGEPTPLRDVLQGTLRQSDYTRKTQELTNQRKQLEAEFNEREEKLKAREQQLSAMEAELDDPEPDWEKLADEDPLGWASAKAKWDKKSKAKAERKAELEQRQTKAKQEFTRKTVDLAIQAMPEWAEAGAFEKNVDARRDAALKAGFSKEEYDATFDYRIAVLLEKAARFDAMSEDNKQKLVRAEKKIAKAPKVLRPGQAKGDTDPAEERRAARQKQFSKPGGISSSDIKRMIGRV